MGWIVSFILLVAYFITDQPKDVNTALLASALFAISGSISFVAQQIKNKTK